jgi:iron complex transport system substrate-binding protein
MSVFPERIVCLTTETTETLYLLGEQHRIVGISRFTVRPPQARREKPRVSAFTSASIDRIEALRPDLVLGFCELQADILARLADRGIAVHLFDQRSIADIFEMIRTLGHMIGCDTKANALVSRLASHVEEVQEANTPGEPRPRIYFEEWNEPPISAIRWVSELIEIAGGEDCFAELRESRLAVDRIIRDPEEIVRRAPDIIIGSWCGKKFQPSHVAARDGWTRIPAVANDELHEIKSSLILSPGPAALTDGLDALHRIVQRWRDS